MDTAQHEIPDLLSDMAEDVLSQIDGLTSEEHFSLVRREHNMTLRGGKVETLSEWVVGLTVGDVLDPHHIVAWGRHAELSEALSLFVCDFQKKWSTRMQFARRILGDR